MITFNLNNKMDELIVRQTYCIIVFLYLWVTYLGKQNIIILITQFNYIYNITKSDDKFYDTFFLCIKDDILHNYIRVYLIIFLLHYY